MRKYLLTLWPSLIWTIVIFLLLGLNSEKVPEFSFFDLEFKDKIYHAGVFFWFSYFWGFFLNGKYPRLQTQTLILVFILSCFYGMGMEYYQKYFTNRTFSWWDGLADATGALLGIWAIKKPLWK